MKDQSFKAGDVVTLKSPGEMMELPGAVYNDVTKKPDPDFDEDFIYSEQDRSNMVYLVETFKALAGVPFIVKEVDGPHAWMPFQMIELTGENIGKLEETGCSTRIHEWWLKRAKGE